MKNRLTAVRGIEHMTFCQMLYQQNYESLEYVSLLSLFVFDSTFSNV
jgi:hypothetical protein